jgi:deoxyribodipyrimidine photolyase
VFQKRLRNSLEDLSNPPVAHFELEPDSERNTYEYYDNDRNWNTFSGGETSAHGRLSKYCHRQPAHDGAGHSGGG